MGQSKRMAWSRCITSPIMHQHMGKLNNLTNVSVMLKTILRAVDAKTCKNWNTHLAKVKRGLGACPEEGHKNGRRDGTSLL